MSEFAQLSAQFWGFFKDGMDVVLATCAEGNVTARTVSTVELKGKLYFITTDTTVKYAQIKANPNVALCRNDVQLRGTAAILPVESYPAAMEKVLDTFPEAVGFSKLPGTVLIEISPRSASFGPAETIYAIDFNNKSTRRITLA